MKYILDKVAPDDFLVVDEIALEGAKYCNSKVTHEGPLEVGP